MYGLLALLLVAIYFRIAFKLSLIGTTSQITPTASCSLFAMFVLGITGRASVTPGQAKLAGIPMILLEFCGHRGCLRADLFLSRVSFILSWLVSSGRFS